MLDVAQQKILISDHTKFGKRGMTTIAPLKEFDVIVTDNNCTEENQRLLETIGPKVYLV